MDPRGGSPSRDPDGWLMIKLELRRTTLPAAEIIQSGALKQSKMTNGSSGKSFPAQRAWGTEIAFSL